jgi:hypothetical protein
MWWKAKNNHRNTIAAYGSAIEDHPSKFTYGGWQKIHHVILHDRHFTKLLHTILQQIQ